MRPPCGPKAQSFTQPSPTGWCSVCPTAHQGQWPDHLPSPAQRAGASNARTHTRANGPTICLAQPNGLVFGMTERTTGPTARQFAQPSPTGWCSERPTAQQGQRPDHLPSPAQRAGFRYDRTHNRANGPAICPAQPSGLVFGMTERTTGPTARQFAQPSRTGWCSERPNAQQGQRPGHLPSPAQRAVFRYDRTHNRANGPAICPTQPNGLVFGMTESTTGPTARQFAQPSRTGWCSERPNAQQGQRPGHLPSPAQRAGFRYDRTHNRANGPAICPTQPNGLVLRTPDRAPGPTARQFA